MLLRRMVKKIRKELEESTSERKTNNQRSDTVRTVEIITEVQDINNNEPSKLMHG